LTATTIITPPPPPQQQSNSTPSTSTSPTKSTSSSPPSPAAAIPCWIMDSFVFDDYTKKVNQVSQFVMENKFLEAMGRLIEYGNREFLRSFQLRSEIKQQGSGNGNKNSSGNSNNNDNNIIITDTVSLVPPFEAIRFLETKWLEVLKELVEYGNKNILRNFQLYLVMEEKREEQYVKEVTSGILELKKEERGRAEVQNNNNNITQNHNHNNHNQSWYRPRDKFGRFVSTSTATIYKN
jgi:hypothetical protein